MKDYITTPLNRREIKSVLSDLVECIKEHNAEEVELINNIQYALDQYSKSRMDDLIVEGMCNE